MKLATFGALAVSLALTAAACGSGNSNQPPFGDYSEGGTESGFGESSSGVSSSSGGSSSSGFSGSSSGSGSSSSSSSSGSSGSSSGSSGGSSSGSSSGDGGSCGNCTSDSQCQAACPPVQGGGTNCCDTGSGLCYATTQNACPAAVDAGGGG